MIRMQKISWLIVAVALGAFPIRGHAQPTFPTISARQFASGNAKLKVTGSFSIDADIAINDKASFGDGGMTWVQFGVSGAAEPNVLITFQPDEVGIIIGLGKKTTTAGIMRGEKSPCSGKVTVAGTLVSGQYTCRGISSYDPNTGKMGKVDIEIAFTAKS